jgi:GDP/UDP-N,N'-diacetylbacillosamine 2-epimerase (hydrolysing)
MGISRRIKLGILTSSRADFGIYLPLLNHLKKESACFDLSIIAFGTHLSLFHGYTVEEIIKSGFEAKYQISSILLNDNEESIATSYAITAMKFANFWAEHKKSFDCVLCLGDRFEMAAAVTAGLPFNISFAHIHGGETSLGAIDNVYRHMISLASEFHFVSARPFVEKIYSLVGKNAKCFMVGALSLDDVDKIFLPDKAEFKAKWKIDDEAPFVLVTVHPETRSADKTIEHAKVMEEVLKELTSNFNIVISMPNSDAYNSHFRRIFKKLKANYSDKVVLIENFGRANYFAAMKYSQLIIGNSSSGIIEAASFNRYVINIGDRQKGRLASDNVFHVPFDTHKILSAIEKLKSKSFTGDNIYKIGNTAVSIANALKSQYIDLVK